MLLATTAGPALAAASSAHGATLPAGATQVEPARFDTGMSWSHALKWLDKQYPKSKYPRIEIVNQPGLRAIHLKNPVAADRWEGLNLYEHKGRVKIFVLERAASR